MMPARKARKSAQLSTAPAEQDAVAECAAQLRKIGDKLNLQQKLLYVLYKLFSPGT
ncbi:phorbol-12-myristate-13-acetate-induced protein 1 [Ornithorhynchus anatinus]|uniref:phorbol-12-myristate-13-acetate-induced protein 1 n=1 Tax=Ornithorhynchus anatinus TaxID=9258 RepID=UPI000454B1F2|nr:phorbol-12-myristate-13-acetate-induced protein 1 [Ornithorhynchus anatinus]